MFLFKKKKDNPEVKADAQKAEVKKAAAPPVKVVDKAAKQANAEKQRLAAAEVKTKAPAPAGLDTPRNPDEIADSLLVKVDPNPEIENAVDDAVVAEVLKPVVESGKAPAPSAPLENSAPPAMEVKVTVENKPAAETKPEAAAPGLPSAAPKPAEAVKPAEGSDKKPAEGEKKGFDNGKKSAEEDKGNLFSSLFGKSEVEEETHLDRLIKSLPDISIEEVINEADEVKTLMNEWFQSQKR